LLGEKEPSLQFTTLKSWVRWQSSLLARWQQCARGVAWNMDGGWSRSNATHH
jgi:hypothetical protein